jgi:signal peptidase I
VAIAILPPIIPKYDWYLQGVSLLLLAGAVYFAIDRTQQHEQAPAGTHRRHKARYASDVMSLVLTVFLALFMTGFFTYKPTVILSNSMKPVYGRGAMVIVQKVGDPMDVQVGDIVQYWRRDVKITHRVLAIDTTTDGTGKRTFITQGDNSPSKDPPVNESQIIGIVRAQIPFIGYPTVWLTDISKPNTAHP